MKDKKGIFENEVEPSTNMNDHMIDCHMINRDEEEETTGEAMG